MVKRKHEPRYEAKTGEEILQHISRYLYEMYKAPQGGWYCEDSRQSYRLISSLIKTLGDSN